MAVPFPKATTQLVDGDGVATRVGFRLLQRITDTLNSIGYVLSGTHADRLALDVSQLTNGSAFFETDRDVIYALVGGTWRFGTGLMQGNFGQQPLDLGVSDRGFEFGVEDYGHVVKWCGAAWYFAPGDDGPGYFADFAIAPAGAGWHLCDGSATTYLTVGAALGSAAFVTPALTGTPAYRKSGAAYTGVLNAAGNTDVDTGAGTVVAAGVGSTVAAHTHVHVEGNPPNLVVLPYFRR